MHQTMQGELLYLQEAAFGIVNPCWCSDKSEEDITKWKQLKCWEFQKQSLRFASNNLRNSEMCAHFETDSFR